MEKGNNNNLRKFNSRMQANLLLVFCVITLLMVGLIGRLIYLNNADGEKYAKKVLSRQAYTSAIVPYKRGDILDRNGTVIAKSELQYRLIIDPQYLLLNDKEIDNTKEALKKYFNIDSNTVDSVLSEKPDSRYYVLLKNLKHDAVKDFKEDTKKDSDIKGIYLEEEYIRTYPYDTLACDVIGFTSTDNVGYWGLEEYYNDKLNGVNGREYGYYDSNLNVERIVKKAENGNSLVSTIDINVQRIVQEKIKEFNKETGSLNIGVLVMNPNNGEVYAMASNQEYNLNDPRNLKDFYTEAQIKAMSSDEKMEALNKIWGNDCISFPYEPGSTFKPVTVAAGLEEGLIHDGDTYLCDGVEDISGTEIHCVNRSGHGLLTLEQSLMKSCNDAMMQIVRKEGKDLFVDYQDKFGFGEKTGIDLPGESPGIMKAIDEMGPVDLATNSFGQNFNSTMVQMAAAFSSIVNGGNYYEPHMVKQIINDGGAVVKQNDKVLVRQTVSKETSELLKRYLYSTVEEGTASGAKVPGYAIGGKTGTAQKQPRNSGKYLISFIGAAPIMNPEVVIYVFIDEPNIPEQFHSVLACEFAGKILKEILPALGIFPDGEIEYHPVENADEANENPPANGENANNQEDTSQNNDGTSQNNVDTAPSEGTEPVDNQGVENDQTENNNPDDTSGLENEAGTTDEGAPDNLDENQDTDNSAGDNADNEDEFNGEAIPAIDE